MALNENGSGSSFLGALQPELTCFMMATFNSSSSSIPMVGHAVVVHVEIGMVLPYLTMLASICADKQVFVTAWPSNIGCGVAEGCHHQFRLKCSQKRSA